MVVMTMRTLEEFDVSFVEYERKWIYRWLTHPRENQHVIIQMPIHYPLQQPTSAIKPEDDKDKRQHWEKDQSAPHGGHNGFPFLVLHLEGRFLRRQ